MRCLKCNRILIAPLKKEEDIIVYKCIPCMIIIEIIVYKISPENNLPVEVIIEAVRQKPIDFEQKQAS